MKTKRIPLIVMLLAGAAASISTRLMHDDLETSLWILLSVLIVFYIIGCVLRRVLESFEAQIEKKEKDEKESAADGEAEEKDGMSEESAQEDGVQS